MDDENIPLIEIALNGLRMSKTLHELQCQMAHVPVAQEEIKKVPGMLDRLIQAIEQEILVFQRQSWRVNETDPTGYRLGPGTSLN